ncbi:ankyrin repeat-containing domain protein [Aspergillus multicolor]|uniref:ankyrin repeat domain-containing protein n=1 Tax=Aspergillus multicolor TaxID=41759 RepID=UPI003CCD7387
MQNIIDLGADIERLDDEGNTPLLAASQASMMPSIIMETLLEARANANVRDSEGLAPLAYFIMRGAPRYISSVSRYPMNYEKCIHELLLDNGADLNMMDAKGRTPLHFLAAHAQTANGARDLLIRGAHVDPRDHQGNTPLHYVLRPHCPFRSMAICICLLEYGANPNLLSGDGQSPLHLILHPKSPARPSPKVIRPRAYSFRSVCEIFLRNGADSKVVDGQGKTPLHLLLSGPLLGQDEYGICVRLLQRGADVNARDHLGLTPLGCLAQFLDSGTAVGDLESVKTTMGLLREHEAVI